MATSTPSLWTDGARRAAPLAALLALGVALGAHLGARDAPPSLVTQTKTPHELASPVAIDLTPTTTSDDVTRFDAAASPLSAANAGSPSATPATPLPSPAPAATGPVDAVLAWEAAWRRDETEALATLLSDPPAPSLAASASTAGATPTRRIAGLVLDQDGRPLPGVRVSAARGAIPDDLVDALGPWPTSGGLGERLRRLREAALAHRVAAGLSLEATTDAQGRFTFEAVPRGVELDVAPVAEGMLFERDPETGPEDELVDIEPSVEGTRTAAPEREPPPEPPIVFHGRPARRVEIRATDATGAPVVARMHVKGFPYWHEERFSRAPLVPLGAWEVRAFPSGGADGAPTGRASLEVAPSGPTPAAVIALVEEAIVEAAPGKALLSGRVTGLFEDPRGRSEHGRDLTVRAMRVAPGTDPASVSDERLRSSGQSERLRGDRFVFAYLEPGLHVVAVGLDQSDGTFGPRRLVDLSAGQVTIDLAAPTQALLALEAEARDQRSFAVRVHAPDGLPKWTYLDVPAPDGARPEQTFYGAADATGWAILRAPKGAPDPTPVAPVRAEAHEHGSQVAPLEVTAPGRGVVRLRPWAALRVRVAEPTLRDLGGRVVVHLAPLEVEPSYEYDLKNWMGVVTSGSETWLGPVPAGAYALRLAVAERSERDDAVHFRARPVSSRRIDLAGGLNETTVGLEGVRDVTVTAPGPGLLTIAAILGGATGAPPVHLDAPIPEESLRARLDALPALPHVVGFTPEGGRDVSEVMILAPDASGDVAFTPVSAAGMGLLVRRSAYRPAYVGVTARDGVRERLLGGDVVIAVDGAPIADPLRPFGERIAAGAPDTPITLEVLRGGARRTLVASSAALRSASRDDAGGLFLPYPLR